MSPKELNVLTQILVSNLLINTVIMLHTGQTIASQQMELQSVKIPGNRLQKVMD